MRLISLTSNKPGFHPVNFRQKGTSFIVGKEKKQEQENAATGQTFNGGRQILVALFDQLLLGRGLA